VTSAQLPWASQPAIKHPPTGRAIRRRLLRQGVLLLVMWPALILIPLLGAASGNERFVPILGMVMCVLAPVLLPLNIWSAVSALRMHRVLSTHSWRRVECEVVPVTRQGRRLVELADQMPGREVKVPAVLRINDVLLTAAPYRRFVNARLTQLWCAGHPHQGGVAAEPEGARPFRLVRYKGLVSERGAGVG
jgi:hypothetical protein